jgi:hypothetical protein
MKKKLLVTLSILIAIATFTTIYVVWPKEDIPLSEIDVSVNINRFDDDLFAIGDVTQEGINLLEAKYGSFFQLFSQGIIGIGNPGEEGFSDYLSSFLTDKMVTEVKQRVDEVFPNTNELNLELTKAFKRVRYHFPNQKIPAIYGFVSGFNNSIVLGDSIVGIGFDRYLGRSCAYYPKLGIHNYLSYNMHPQKIPSDVMRTFALGEFPYNDSINNLINNMIYEGMLMYYTKQMLPNQPDSLIFGFTPNQIKFLRSNEKFMWTYLVEHKLLFNSETFNIRKYVGEAPFTQGFPKESPGRAAVWIGYRIIESYMASNKNVSLSQLMHERNYQRILNQSRYKP